jgi:16S rRNA (uracil1498-N3)-methyltransferase
MPANRYFCDADFKVGAQVSLEGAECHHLLHVMRASINQELELVNGRGALAHSRLISFEKKRRAVCFVEEVQQEEKPTSSIRLIQALPRASRLDTIVEKTTELGIDELILFPGKLSERKVYSEKSWQRLKGVAIAAMKQCGRLYLPAFSLWSGIDRWEKLKVPAFFGDLNLQAPKLSDELSQISRRESITFIVGPEAGFTSEEEEQLKVLGVKGVRLHHNILRTDTASIVALALISHLKR